MKNIMISAKQINEISAATKAICPKDHSHGHQVVVWLDGSWSEAVDSTSCTGRSNDGAIERPLMHFVTPTSRAETAAMIRNAEAERERRESYERGEDLRARQVAGGKIGAARTAEVLGPAGRTERARAGAAARWGKRGKVIAKYTEPRGLDVSYRRSWRLYSSGLLERANGASKYQPWAAGEQIPAPIKAAAREHSVKIQPGRAIEGAE